MSGPVTLKIGREMKFYRSARRPPFAWPTPRGAATHDSAKFRVGKIRDQKNRKKSSNFYFSLRFQKRVRCSILTTFSVADPPRLTSAYPTSGGGTFDSAKIPGSNFGSEKIQTKKIEQKVEIFSFQPTSA